MSNKQEFEELYAAFETLERACSAMYDLVMHHNERIKKLEESLKDFEENC